MARKKKAPPKKIDPLKILYVIKPVVEQEIKEMMQGEGIKTLTKAIDACIMSYRRDQANIKELRSELSRTRTAAHNNAGNIRRFVDSLNILLEGTPPADQEEDDDSMYHEVEEDDFDDDDDI